MSTSCGGLTRSLLEESSKALLNYLSTEVHETTTEEREGEEGIGRLTLFSKSLLKCFRENERVDRLTCPLLKVVALILSSELGEKEETTK